jgi:hypothetical protein
MFAPARTRSFRWELLAALLVSGWVSSLIGSVFAGFALSSAGRTVPFAAMVIGALLQAVVLRQVLEAMGAGRLSIAGALVVGLVGQLSLAAGLLLIREQGGFAPALGGMSVLLSLVGLALQYQLLIALVEERARPDESRPVVAALMETAELGYGDVLNGVRETTDAINYAIAAPTDVDASFDEELIALTAHERRLRELGAPSPAAEGHHAALLQALNDLRVQLVARHDEHQPELPAAERVLVLTRELAVLAAA